MSVVISSYQTGRPSNVEVATAIKHLRICQRAHSPSIGARVQTASLARADDNRITNTDLIELPRCRRGPGPVAGSPHFVLGAKSTRHGRGACGRSGDAPPGATR